MLSHLSVTPAPRRIRRLDVEAVHSAQARAPKKRDARNVRRLCGRVEAHTRSHFERRFPRFCRRHGLPSSMDAPSMRARVRSAPAAAAIRSSCARYATVRLVWEGLDDDAALETAADLRVALA